MTKKKVSFLRKELDLLSCLNEESLRQLLSSVIKIRDVDYYLNKAVSKKESKDISSFNEGDLAESERQLNLWFKKKIKKYMCSTFQNTRKIF